MAQVRPRNINLHSRTQSADSIRELLIPAEASMLFSLLPTAVQARIPRLPSIRRSVSSFPITRRKFPDSKPGSRARTPELGYTSAMVLSRPEGTGNEDEVTSYFGGSVSSDEEDMQVGATGDAINQGQGKGLAEPSTGIAWKFANQGRSFRLVQLEYANVFDRRFTSPQSRCR